MTKLIVSLFFLLVCLNNPLAQVDNVTGQFVDKGNLLQSPGAESGKKGWTNVAGTFTVESTGAIKGSRVFKVALSSQTLNLYQDSTSYASEFNGSVQGISYAYVKTSVSGIKLCARKAGVTQTSLCVSHTGSGKWELLKVPFILGATSNGLAIISSGNVSGNVFVDDSFVGAVDLKVDVDASSFVGSLKYAASTNCEWVVTSTTMSNYPADIDCASPTTTGQIQAPSTKIPAFKIPPGISGKIMVVTKGLFASTDAGVTCGFRLSDGTISSNPSGQYSSSVGMGTGSMVFSLDIPNGNSERTFNIQSTSASGSCAIFNFASDRQELSFEVYRFANGSTYSSTNADTDWASFTPTGSWTSNTTYSGKWMRKGKNMKIRYNVTLSGIPNLTSLELNLPPGYSIDTSVTPTTNNAVGTWYAIDTGVNDYSGTAILTTVSQIFLVRDVGGISYNNPFSFNNGDRISVEVEVPIQGWEQSNVIVAQLSGLESCADSYECESVFSAKVNGTTGAISDENIDWVNGQASVSGGGNVYTIPFKVGLFTVSPNCVFVSSANNSLAHTVQVSVSSTQLVVASSATNTGNASPGSFNVICQKQGVDYVAKSAKAVSSDQNVRSFATNAVLYSAALNFNCSIIGQTGSWLTLVSGTGSGTGCNYIVNSGRVLSKMVCTTTSVTSNNCSNVTGLSVSGFGIRNKTCDTNANSDDGVYIMCHGEQ